MKCILSADNNWGIGLRNSLLIRIPADMKNFRLLTTGNVVIMGRKTLESFPGQKPLADRINIVITSRQDYTVPGAEIVHSVEEAVAKAKSYSDREIYVIGGSQVYRQMLPYCDTAIVTRIDHSYEADAFFPNLDASDEWELAEESEENTCFDITYTYCTYHRVKPAQQA